jgi:hypothetical protein
MPGKSAVVAAAVRAIGQHAANVFEVDRGAVLGRVVMLGHLRDPFALNGAAVDRGAFGRNAEFLGFLCHATGLGDVGTGIGRQHR